MSAQSPGIRRVLWLIVPAGCVVLAWSLVRVLGAREGHQWGILAAVAAIAGPFTVRIPRVNAKISVAETFVFANTVLFGPAAGSVTAALDGFMGSMRTRTGLRRAEHICFNTALMALSGWLAGEVFFVFLRGRPLFGNVAVTLGQTLLPMVSMAVAHNLLNSFGVAVITALECRCGILRFWIRNYLWTLPGYLMSASMATLVAVNVNELSIFVLAALLPVLVLLHFSYRTYAEKVEQRFQHERLGRTYLRTVETLALAVDVKDPITHGHVRRVRAYAIELARLAGVRDPDELMAVEMAALLHDIGKLAVDESIVTKPGPLTDSEFEDMKRHSAAGSEILEQVQYPYPVADYVRSHHERWDGGGYPDGLKGEEIPLGARVLAIVDAFDAARSARPYKRALFRDECVDAILAGSGTVYDPRLVRLFVERVDALEQMATEAAQSSTAFSFHRPPAEQRPRAAVAAEGGRNRSPGLSLELASLQLFCEGTGAELELSDLLAVVVRRTRRLLPWDTCVVYLKGSGQNLVARHGEGRYAARLQGTSLPWAAGVSGWVAAYQKPILNGNPRLDLEDVADEPPGLSDVLAVPLVVAGSSIGAVAVYAEAPGTFGPVHLELLQEMARVVAPVVERARYRECLPADDRAFDVESRAYPASHFTAVASVMLNSARETGSPVALVCIDFEAPGPVRPVGVKAENRSVLQRIAATVRAELPPTAALFHFGEHRLVAVFDSAKPADALSRGQRLQLRIRNMSVGGKREPAVACQVGVASFPEDGGSLQLLLEVAERRLAGLYVADADRFRRTRKPAARS